MGCCDDFVRASAGRGLPEIEAGMPAPAGTGLSRRTFMLRSLGGALAVYGAPRLGMQAFEEGIAHATVPDGRVLVSVFMGGGVDGMSLLAPVGHERYSSLRPTLALSPDGGVPFSEDDSLIWSPSADPLRQLHAAGKVSVLPAVGYTGPDQSHFTSRHFWEIGETSVHGRFGWLGRYLDHHGDTDNPLQGLALGYSLAPSLAASQVPVASLPDPTDFTLHAGDVSGQADVAMQRAIGGLGRLPTTDPARQRARLVASQVGKIREDLSPYSGGVAAPPGVTYPTGNGVGAFARRLRALSKMIADGLPVRAIAIDAPGGYDTHSDQARTFDNDISRTFSTLAAFQSDLEARGIADRVLIHVWSEFGRRPQQNENGTDHGAAGIGFLIGSRVAGTQIGEFPGLASLDAEHNLPATSDFRGVYAGILEQWFGVDAAPIIPGADSFAQPALLRT